MSTKAKKAEQSRTAEAAARSPTGTPTRAPRRKKEEAPAPAPAPAYERVKISKAEAQAKVDAEYKVPKKPGEAADLLYTTRERRLNLQKEVDALEAFEKKLKNHLIDSLPKSSATGAAGKIARVQIVTEDMPVVQDWDEFYKHIKKKGEFDLLNRAVNRSAVKARWDNGKDVPGVGHFTAVKVSVTKV